MLKRKPRAEPFWSSSSYSVIYYFSVGAFPKTHDTGVQTWLIWIGIRSGTKKPGQTPPEILYTGPGPIHLAPWFRSNPPENLGSDPEQPTPQVWR